MNKILKLMCAAGVGFLLVLSSCSKEDKHRDYTRMVGKWKEISNTVDGKPNDKHETWYAFRDDLGFESYTGKGYTYELDTTKHVIKAFGESLPESGINKKSFKVLMFEKGYRFSGDTLVLEVVSKADGKTLKAFYLKAKED